MERDRGRAVPALVVNTELGAVPEPSLVGEHSAASGVSASPGKPLSKEPSGLSPHQQAANNSYALKYAARKTSVDAGPPDVYAVLSAGKPVHPPPPRPPPEEPLPSPGPLERAVAAVAADAEAVVAAAAMAEQLGSAADPEVLGPLAMGALSLGTEEESLEAIMALGRRPDEEHGAPLSGHGFGAHQDDVSAAEAAAAARAAAEAEAAAAAEAELRALQEKKRRDAARLAEAQAAAVAASEAAAAAVLAGGDGRAAVAARVAANVALGSRGSAYDPRVSNYGMGTEFGLNPTGGYGRSGSSSPFGYSGDDDGGAEHGRIVVSAGAIAALGLGLPPAAPMGGGAGSGMGPRGSGGSGPSLDGYIDSYLVTTPSQQPRPGSNAMVCEPTPSAAYPSSLAPSGMGSRSELDSRSGPDSRQGLTPRGGSRLQDGASPSSPRRPSVYGDDDEDARFIASRDERSRKIAAQLAALQQESRHLQQQHMQLQERTREISRSVGLRTPQLAPLVFGGGALGAVSPMPGPAGSPPALPPALPPVLNAHVTPRAASWNANARASPGAASSRGSARGTTGDGLAAMSAAAAVLRGASSGGDSSLGARGAASPSGIVITTNAATPPAASERGPAGPGSEGNGLLASFSSASTTSQAQADGTAAGAPIQWNMPNRALPPGPGISGSPMRSFPSPPKLHHGRAPPRLERAESASSSLDPPLPTWSDQLESPMSSPMARSPSKSAQQHHHAQAAGAGGGAPAAVHANGGFGGAGAGGLLNSGLLHGPPGAAAHQQQQAPPANQQQHQQAHLKAQQAVGNHVNGVGRGGPAVPRQSKSRLAHQSRIPGPPPDLGRGGQGMHPGMASAYPGAVVPDMMPPIGLPGQQPLSVIVPEMAGAYAHGMVSPHQMGPPRSLSPGAVRHPAQNRAPGAGAGGKGGKPGAAGGGVHMGVAQPWAMAQQPGGMPMGGPGMMPFPPMMSPYGMLPPALLGGMQQQQQQQQAHPGPGHAHPAMAAGAHKPKAKAGGPQGTSAPAPPPLLPYGGALPMGSWMGMPDAPGQQGQGQARVSPGRERRAGGGHAHQQHQAPHSHAAPELGMGPMALGAMSPMGLPYMGGFNPAMPPGLGFQGFPGLVPPDGAPNGRFPSNARNGKGKLSHSAPPRNAAGMAAASGIGPYDIGVVGLGVNGGAPMAGMPWGGMAAPPGMMMGGMYGLPGAGASMLQRADAVAAQQMEHYQQVERTVLGKLERKQGRDRRRNSHDGRPVFKLF